MDAALLPRTDHTYEPQFPHAFSSSVRTPQLLNFRKSVWKTRRSAFSKCRFVTVERVRSLVQQIPAREESWSTNDDHCAVSLSQGGGVLRCVQSRS